LSGRPAGLPGAVVGLRREARLLARLAPGIRVACSGADPDRAARAAERLLAEGAPGLVSFGLAGGLAPGLPPGRLLLPAGVLLPEGGTLAVDPAWHARARAALPAAETAPVAGSDHALADPAAKAALHRAGAVAVDMESHAVARAAAAAGKPFLVIRAVADPAGRALPRAALVAVAPDGGTRLAAVLLALARRPGEVAGLLRLARDGAAAFAALGGVGALGPRLAFA
jgi:hopanoid-associated phosphorylase